MWRNSINKSSRAAFISLVLVLSTCSPLQYPFANELQQRIDIPNIIFITIDTLRADHLGLYGYQRNTSPQIDAFARNATVYKRAYTSAPWTVPSIASMFTGKYPFEHGAHTFQVQEPRNNVNPLDTRYVTLAETLKKEGYSTGAFVANAGFLSERWKLNQGFDTYHVERVYAKVLNEQIFKWIETQKGKKFFLFINYIDTHWPYNTTPHPGFLEEPAVQDKGELLRSLRKRVLPGKGAVPHDLVQKVLNQYDTAVVNVDEQVGALLKYLAKIGLYSTSVVIVTSDHGEFFGEHHLTGHSKDIYQEVLWVPLIIKRPGQTQGTSSDGIVSSADMPTLIASQLPSDIAAKCAHIFPRTPGSYPVISENYYTRYRDLFNPEWGKRFNRIRTALYKWPYKYILSSDEKHELYNLEDDPKELNNLIEQQKEIGEKLFRTLEQFQDRSSRAEERVDDRPLTEEDVERLKALGYISD
jgi:arylsulfatase A-like enzyme